MIPALLSVLLAVPARAAGDAALPAAVADAAGRVPVVSLREVDACFERAADARADALRLPKRFCLKKVGTSVPSDDRSPFAFGATGLVDDGAGPRPVHLSGALRTARGWGVDADIFSFDAPREKCGALNHAFAAAYYDVDLAGKPLDGLVEVRGFLADESPLCAREAAAVELDYRRVP